MGELKNLRVIRINTHSSVYGTMIGSEYLNKINDFIEVCKELETELETTICVKNTGIFCFNYSPLENQLIASPLDHKLFKEHNGVKAIAIKFQGMGKPSNSDGGESFSISDFINHIEKNPNIERVYVLVSAHILAYKDDPRVKELLLALKRSSKVQLDYAFLSSLKYNDTLLN